MRRRLKRAAWLAVGAATAVAAVLAVLAALSWSEVAGPGLLILTYHRVVADTVPASAYKTPVSAFARELELLREQGFTFVGPEDLDGAAVRSPRKPVLLTFDDGTEDHAAAVLDQLEARGVKGLFFVIVDKLDTPGYLSREALSRLAGRGQGIGSHLMAHAYLDELCAAEQEREIRQSKVALEKLIGRPVLALAPPGGWYDAESVRLTRAAGYRHLFSCLVGVNPPGADDLVYRRVSVPGAISPEAFVRLISPSGLLRERVKQRIKLVAHGLIGSTRYVAVSDWLRR